MVKLPLTLEEYNTTRGVIERVIATYPEGNKDAKILMAALGIIGNRVVQLADARVMEDST